ncbi:MAG: lytic transglycosylase F, partial [Pseudomonadales bacterium]
VGIHTRISDPWYGDFDAMVEERIIRALVVPNRTNYFLDGPAQRGASYEFLKKFETSLNKKLKTRHLKIQLIIIPTTRQHILSDLIAGKGDIAIGNLTVTEERLLAVDFTLPIVSNIDEIIVAAANAPKLSSLDDLSGKKLYIRKSSSFWQSARALNGELVLAGKEPVNLIAADEVLETEDILEMVNANMVPYTVADNYLAEFWAQVYTNIQPHNELKLREDSNIAWAIRKDTPLLKAELDGFIKQNRKGTLLGNILFRRYLQDTQWVDKSLDDVSADKFNGTMEFFEKYGAEYNFDPLMLAAVGYQESKLKQSRRSSRGAVGVMQLLPTTAADKNVGIKNIQQVENNIHAGTKYLRFISDRYFDDPALTELDRNMLTFASYNAGPARIRRLRNRAAEQGLDPNVWFDNVEVLAAKDIGNETVQYVSNIYKYYVAYKYLEDHNNGGRSTISAPLAPI